MFFAFLLVFISGILMQARRDSSDARLVAHSDFWDGSSDIYLRIPGSQHNTNLTRNPAFDTQPTWSPDGSWIAFVSDQERRSDGRPLNGVYIMRPDGSAMQKLGSSSPATGTRVVSWSPDGQWLFMKYITQGWWDSYFVRVADGFTQSLRFDTTFTMYAAWSPVDDWLAFRTGMDDDPETSIGIAHPDGSDSVVHPTILVSSPDYIDYLLWSPDGEWIAYTSRERKPGGQYTLYRMRRDGSGLVRLHTNPLSYIDLVWSLDGSYIYFMTDNRDANGVYRIRADGSDGGAARELTGRDGFFKRLAWSPDGEWLTFILSNHPYDDIYRVDPNGGKPVLLRRVEGYINRLTWTADGRWIYYTTGQREQSQLYRMRPDGEQAEYLTDVAFDWDIPVSPVVDLPWHGVLLMGIGMLLALAAVVSPGRLLTSFAA